MSIVCKFFKEHQRKKFKDGQLIKVRFDSVEGCDVVILEEVTGPVKELQEKLDQEQYLEEMNSISQSYKKEEAILN